MNKRNLWVEGQSIDVSKSMQMMREEMVKMETEIAQMQERIAELELLAPSKLDRIKALAKKSK